MILVAIYQKGRCIGRCDARCYLAVHGACACICQGKNHGVGLRKAIDQTREQQGDWLKAVKKQHGRKCEALLNQEVFQPSLPFDDSIPTIPAHIQELDNMTHVFRGMRTREGIIVTYNGAELPPRNDWRNHSPDGFEWGYGGSGPAQLALAILGALVSKRLALMCYQQFKFQVVAGLPKEGFTLSAESVNDWLRSHLEAAVKSEQPTADE